VLARPSGAKKAGILGPVGVAVAVLAGAGLVYYLAFGKKKRKAAA
jgi:threonine/homoserine efflux transporter RhtA